MTNNWSGSMVASFARDALRSSKPEQDGYEIVDISSDNDAVLIEFRFHQCPTRCIGRFAFAPLPIGPSTGEESASAEVWARELRWFFDEEVGAGRLGDVETRRKADGSIHFDWPDGDSDVGAATQHNSPPSTPPNPLSRRDEDR